MQPKYYKGEDPESVIKVTKDLVIKICGNDLSVLKKEIWGNYDVYAQDPTYGLCTEADYHNALIPLKELIDGELSNAKIYENE